MKRVLAWLCTPCAAPHHDRVHACALCDPHRHGQPPGCWLAAPAEGCMPPQWWGQHALEPHRGRLTSLAGHDATSCPPSSTDPASISLVGCHPSYRVVRFKWPQAGQRTPAASGAARQCRAAAQQLQQTPQECACASEPTPGCCRLCTAGTWRSGEGPSQPLAHTNWERDTRAQAVPAYTVCNTLHTACDVDVLVQAAG